MRNQASGITHSIATRNRGSAFVWVLLLVIIVVGVVTIGQKFFGWGSPGDPDECPWLEEDRIVGLGGTVTLPQPPKTDLEIWANFRVKPVLEDQERGTLEVNVTEEGFVFGTWKAEYDVEDTTYTFSSSFDGNIDVSKTYVDENGNEEPSMLYIIAMGNYTKQTYNNKTNRGGVGGGEAYLTGWLRPDGTGFGKITQAFDEEIVRVLMWER